PPVPPLPPSSQTTVPPAICNFAQTTTGKNVSDTRSRSPVATPEKTLPTTRSPSTPARSPRPEPPPPAATPAPLLHPVPTATLPCNANSGSSALVPHSHPPTPP